MRNVLHHAWGLLLAIAICTAALPPGPAGATTPVAAVSRQLDAYLQSLTQEQEFSGSVLVAQRGTTLLAKTYGWADSARKIRSTATTQFRIASITKQFTALAVLILQQEGKLRVTDRICRYLPTCPVAWASITIAELLDHTSGIPDLEAEMRADGTLAKPISPAALVARFAREPLDFAPGSMWNYSSTGYVVLGDIISRLSGLSYPLYLQRAILSPLGLTHTSYDVDHPAAAPQHAVGYDDWGQPTSYVDMSVAYAAGAMASTAGDLNRWDHMLLADSLRPHVDLRPLFTAHASVCAQQCQPFDKIGYGEGWFVAVRHAQPVYYHTGGINGFSALNMIYPQAGLTVIVLCNLGTTDPIMVGTDLDAIVLGDPQAAA